jgi:uncharacterized protein YjbI with pentapeptide repeats
LPFQRAAVPDAPAAAATGLPFRGAGAAADGPPLEPLERGDTVPPVTRSSLHVVSVPWQVRPPQDSLTVIVKGTFDLVPGEAARLRDESDYPTGDEHEADDLEASLRYPSDFAILKPQADVTVVGSARALDGARTAMEVGFAFGHEDARIERQLVVIGNRRWSGLSPSAPEPFEQLELRWEHAFGGPDDERNPHGRGRAKDAEGKRPLPNLEWKHELISAASDKPTPACFAPLPARWRQHEAQLGSYGDEWLRQRWPYLPEDFDYHFFQHAPPEQRLQVLRGDEPFLFRGMHHEHPELSGQLPGLKPHCFAKRRPEHGGGFVPIELRLDTCAFDIDASKVNLVWRGLLDVSDRYASELEALLVITAQLDAPAPSGDDVQREYRVARQLDELDALDEDDGADDAPLEAAEQRVRRAEQQRAAALHQALPFGGDTAPPERPPLADASPEDIAAQLRDGGASDEQVAAALAAIAEASGDEASADAAATDPAQPITRTALEAYLAAGGELAAVDLSGAVLDGIDLSDRPLDEVVLLDASLRNATLRGASLRAAQLGGCDLRGANLDRAHLDGADLQGANLDGTSFVASSVDECDFTGASGRAAQFREATGHGALFAEGEWSEASFAAAELPGADFTEARIDGASFDEAVLPEVRLYDAEGKASFQGAQLDEARADGAKLAGSSFENARANESVWEGAVLEGCTFHAAELRGASFVRARCSEVMLGRCDLREARFREAIMAKATLIRADLLGSDFEGADLREADLRAASLHGAETWNAILEGARLDGARLSNTKLEGGA